MSTPIETVGLTLLAVGFALGAWNGWRDTKEFSTAAMLGMLGMMAAATLVLLLLGIVWIFENR